MHKAPVLTLFIVCLPFHAICVAVCRFWENHWLWWTAPFVGGLTAGKLYMKFWMPKDQLPAAAKAASKKLL